MADTDICLCGNARSAHPDTSNTKGIAGVLILATGFCPQGGFKLDRKATWKAERGQPVMHMTTVLGGCRLCKRRDVPLRKVPGGYIPERHECKP